MINLIVFFRIHGESFAKLSAAILNKGPNLLILWEQGTNHIFGGFVKDSWKIGPKFYGSNQVCVNNYFLY